MRTITLGLVTAFAVALAGCASADLERFLQQSAIDAPAAEGKPDAAKADAARAEALARETAAKEAICKWAATSGVTDLGAAKTDAPATKRRIASLIAAHEVTCPKASPPITPQPPAAKKS